MKTKFFFSSLLALYLISAVQLYAFNPRDFIFPPTASWTINVILSETRPISCSSEGCAVWWLELWEYNSSSPTTRNMIDRTQYTGGSSYTFSSEVFDNTTYDRIILVWHYVSDGNPCNAPTGDVYSNPQTPSGPNTYQFYDLYPCP